DRPALLHQLGGAQAGEAVRRAAQVAALWLAALGAVSGALWLAAAAGESAASAGERGEAIFAGGCFWCEETAFEGVPGVKAVISGYTGGAKKNPEYEEVSSGTTGHAEAVKVVFDPAKITYVQLLGIFWHSVDPLSA